ncbi:MAG: hypothetical protein M1833_002452 [Piccolia ochrophora]|nr:MAG: hypothetical protein M1833_002452 [Piccolia ochrophora]
MAHIAVQDEEYEQRLRAVAFDESGVFLPAREPIVGHIIKLHEMVKKRWGLNPTFDIDFKRDVAADYRSEEFHDGNSHSSRDSQPENTEAVEDGGNCSSDDEVSDNVVSLERGGDITLDPEQGSWGFLATPRDAARRALTLLDATRRLQLNGPFPLLRLPLELRRQVYQQALAGTERTICVTSLSSSNLMVDYHRFIKEGRPENRPWWGDRVHPHWRNPQSMFHADGAKGMRIDVTLLRVNRQIFDEAEPVLYQCHDFDFCSHIFAAIPFLQSLTERARQNIAGARIVLLRGPSPSKEVFEKLFTRELANANDNDCDWSELCTYIQEHLRLRELQFTVAGSLNRDFQDEFWVKDLVRIRGLQKLSWVSKGERTYAVDNRWAKEDMLPLRRRIDALLAYLRSEML